MEYAEKEKLINFLASNRIYITLGTELYYIKHPTAELKYKADFIYNSALEECKFEEFISSPLEHLNKQGIITYDVNQSLSSLNSRIKDLQVALYKSSLNPKQQKNLRKEITLVREKLTDTLKKKHAFDDATREGFANLIKTQYLIFKNTFYQGRRLWTKISSIDFKLMELLIYKYVTSRLEVSQLREIARTEPWLTIWNAGKPNPFGIRPTDLSDNQKELLYFSEMYENSAKAMEPPPDEVVNDDDLFDGWLQDTIKRLKEERSKDSKKHVVGRNFENSQELYIPAQTIEEAQEINKLNDLTSQMLIKQRSNVIKTVGEATENRLPDKQMELQNLLREAQKGK